MKKLLPFIALCFIIAGVHAQSDSVDSPAPMLDGLHAVPDSLLYDSLYHEEAEMRAPNINPIYYFGSPFCEHFLDLNTLLGTEGMAFGGTYTYLPEVWGAHLGGFFGFNGYWITAGADYRLSKPWSQKDWHLYGTTGICHDKFDNTYNPVLGAGVRMAAVEGLGKFCFTDMSLGLTTNFSCTFVTFGFGLSVAVLTTSFILIGITE